MSKELRARAYIRKHLLELDPERDFYQGNLIAEGFLKEEAEREKGAFISGEMTPIFLQSHNGIWHLAKRRELRGAKTGELFSVYYVCKCNGKSLYRPFSRATMTNQLPENASKCRRCFPVA